MMTFQEMVEEIKYLNREERRQLLHVLIDALDDSEKTHDLIDFIGVGAHLADDEDPQDHIKRLRSEWDHRP
ncbi:MAG: hypothetical protein JNJ61_28850 [Anaerolineae bacterium]|nr:hypothetical protein [Anaerolineae bacterium]